MDKLTLAHDYYMAHVKSGTLVSECEAWAYADNMFYEMDLRQDKTLPDSLWQPDWSQAPDDAVACSMDTKGRMWWLSKSYELDGECWLWNFIEEYENHNYTGDWRNSLRIRPSSK